MKWYSLKKYKPPFCVMDLFVYSGGTTHLSECCAMSDGSYTFVTIDQFGTEIKDVTHFCIPDPVEIEQE